MIKRYIEKIVENGNSEDMKKLSSIFEETLHTLKEEDYRKYKELKCELKGIAYGYKFDEELAKEIVNDMKPLGEYWNVETISQVKSSYNIDEDLYDFYIVMNAMANDYGDIISLEDVDTYAKISKAFIHDEDAIENKVWKYFTTIAKM